MITRYYPSILRTLGLIVVICSGISAALLWAAPPPSGLKNIDPVGLKTTVIVILIALGIVAPLAVVFGPPLRWLPLKAGIFAIAGFSNSVALSSQLAVPFQDTTSIIAVAGGIGLAVVSILALLDTIQKKKPQSKF